MNKALIFRKVFMLVLFLLQFIHLIFTNGENN